MLLSREIQIYQLVVELKTDEDIFPLCVLTHQVPKVAQRVPGQLYDALCEATVVADEARDDVGQAVACSVQHNSGGGSLYWVGTLCRATGKKYTVRFSVLVTHVTLLETFKYRKIL